MDLPEQHVVLYRRNWRSGAGAFLSAVVLTVVWLGALALPALVLASTTSAWTLLALPCAAVWMAGRGVRYDVAVSPSREHPELLWVRGGFLGGRWGPVELDDTSRAVLHSLSPRYRDGTRLPRPHRTAAGVELTDSSGRSVRLAPHVYWEVADALQGAPGLERSGELERQLGSWRRPGTSLALQVTLLLALLLLLATLA